MKFFKDRYNEVFVITDAMLHLVQRDWVEITAEEGEVLRRNEQNVLKIEALTPNQIEAIKERLLAIDVESIRPLRAIMTNTAEYYDHQKLKTLNEERLDLLKVLRVNS